MKTLITKEELLTEANKKHIQNSKNEYVRHFYNGTFYIDTYEWFRKLRHDAFSREELRDNFLSNDAKKPFVFVPYFDLKN